MSRPKETVAMRLKDGWQDEIKALSREGASDVELRAHLGISQCLFERWMVEEEEFSVTIKECRDLCQIWWERTGRGMAGGDRDGNATVWIFNMKNRFGWKDKQEISGDKDNPVQHSVTHDLDSKTLEMLISKL